MVFEEALTVGGLAEHVRSKNAGPFWLTLDVFLRNERDFEFLLESGAITATAIGQLYGVDPQFVQIYEIPELNVVKVSFPRPVPAGSFFDRDQHAGQQFIPLARLPLPAKESQRGAERGTAVAAEQ